MTFSNAEVKDLLNKEFVCTWYNQAQDLFPGTPAQAGDRQPAVSEHYLNTFPDGGGGPNVKIFFCRPDGRILHFIQGHYRPDTFLAEARFALDLMKRASIDIPVGAQFRSELACLHDQRRDAFLAHFNNHARWSQPADGESKIDMRRRRVVMKILASNHEKALQRLLQDPRPYMVNEALGIA